MSSSVHHPAPMHEAFAQQGGQGSPSVTRWLASGAVAGPIVLTLTWIILGAVRPGYSQVGQQVSDLGLGATAPFMNTSFVLSGLLLLLGVVGIQRSLLAESGRAVRLLCATLLCLDPLGLVLCGVFPETALAGHVTGAVLAFLTPIVGFLAAGLILRREARGRVIGNWLLLVASPLTLVLVILFFQAGAPGAPFAALRIGGLSERVMAEQILFWYMVLGWLAFRFPSHRPVVGTVTAPSEQ